MSLSMVAFGILRQLEAERQIFVNGHVRPQVIALEHHCGRPLFGRQADDGLAVDRDITAGHIQKAADGAQDRGLAAAGRPQEGNDLAFVNIQIDMLNASPLSYFLVISLICNLILRSLMDFISSQSYSTLTNIY